MRHPAAILLAPAALLLMPAAAWAQTTPLLATGAPTMAQWGVDRTVTPWLICHSDLSGRCGTFATQDPATGRVTITGDLSAGTVGGFPLSTTLAAQQPGAVAILGGSVAADVSNSTVSGIRLASWLTGGLITTASYAIDMTATTASDTGMAAFIAACLAPPGHDCSMAPGTIQLNGDLVIDTVSNASHGFRIHGAGQQATWLRFATGHGVKIIDSANGGVFYGHFSGFGVLANASTGAAMQLGQTGLTDALNGFSFADLILKNTANVAGSQGLQLNQVYSSDFTNITTSAGCPDPYGNCPAGGASLELRQASFNRFQGSFSGAGIGTHLTYGYNFGNVFNAIDHEVNYKDIRIDSAQSRFNKFDDGQYAWGNSGGTIGCAFDFVAGQSNIVDNPNLTNSTTAICNSTGLILRGDLGLVNTPAFPASATTVTNTTGRAIMVSIYNMGSGYTLCYLATAATCITPAAASAVTTVPFRPGDQIKLTYTGSPGGWIWAELIN